MTGDNSMVRLEINIFDLNFALFSGHNKFSTIASDPNDSSFSRKKIYNHQKLQFT